MKIPLIRGRLFDDSDRVDGAAGRDRQRQPRPSRTGATAIRSASASSSRSTDRGSRWSACPATWCTTGSCGSSRPSIGRSARRRRTRSRSRCAPSAIRTRWPAICGARSSKVDADQPIASLAALDTLVEERAAGFAFIARALGVVGAIALVLSMMGIYSLMAFLTAQRTQEIGVRMALGAGKLAGGARDDQPRARRSRSSDRSSARRSRLALGRAMQSMLFGLVATSLLQLVALVMVLGRRRCSPPICPRAARREIDPMAALRRTVGTGIVLGRGCRLGRTLSPELQPRRRQHPPLGARRVAPAAPARLDAGRTGASRRGSRRSPAPPARSCWRGWCGACRSR